MTTRHPPTAIRHALAALLLSLPLAASATETTPTDAMSALWRAMSHPAGGSADTATLARLLHPEAVVFGGRYRDGVPGLRRTSGADFLAANEGVRENGFFECEVARTLQVYDRFAVAYSVVESRSERDAAVADFVGVNSVQLYRTGEQWQVVSLYYHVEAPGQPVPLDGGRTGVCL